MTATALISHTAFNVHCAYCLVKILVKNKKSQTQKPDGDSTNGF